VAIAPRLDEESVAEQYGRARRAHFLRWSWEGSLPVEGVFTIVSLE